MPNAQAGRGGFWQRNWKWMLPVGCLGQRLVAQKRAGTWHYQELVVAVDGDARRLNLLSPSSAEP